MIYPDCLSRLNIFTRTGGVWRQASQLLGYRKIQGSKQWPIKAAPLRILPARSAAPENQKLSSKNIVKYSVINL
jgi:hypothetical protein